MTTTEATASTPAGLMKLFSARAAAGDLDGLMELYDDDAAFQPEFGVTLVGRNQIRPASEEFLAMAPKITYTAEPHVVIAGDIALVPQATVLTRCGGPQRAPASLWWHRRCRAWWVS